MPILFTIRSNVQRRYLAANDPRTSRFVATVHAVPGAGIRSEVPDALAIREGLPHYWRKAWDRACTALAGRPEANPWWWANEPGAGEHRPYHILASVTLTSTRGKPLTWLTLTH